MKTEWDYTTLADAYLLRPDYSVQALEAMVRIMGLSAGDTVCDVGAGVAHLTLPLAERGLLVSAVEPNDAMRANGIARTAALDTVRWFEGTGEKTGMASGQFDAVCFGSSFNVCDRPAALRETSRILKAGGWFACLWNHRDLSDPIQAAIEATIARHVPGYSHGVRRSDQTEVIAGSGLFEPALRLSGRVVHEQSVAQCVEAWRSHATLERQAGSLFQDVVAAIESYLSTLGKDRISIPYDTNIWLARKR